MTGGIWKAFQKIDSRKGEINRLFDSFAFTDAEEERTIFI